MSDAVTTARSARESLARGLSALQSDPNVPPQLLELAAPIAQAMGALHQIERSGGAQLVPHASVAQGHVRTALAGLQTQAPSHPAIMAAMEAVAGSLGLVHVLTKLAEAPPAAPPAPVQSQGAYAATQAVPASVPQPRAAPVVAGNPYAPFPEPPHASTAFQRPSQEAFNQAPVPPQQMFQPPAQQPPAQQPPAQRPPAQAQQVPAPAYAAAGDPFAGSGGGRTVPASEMPLVNADLGAHSPSNFYKGLAGNDIIDHGGLFVSTYKIPKIGSPVRIKISLPGGYEFEANAIVRWSRESSDGSNDAPPGFGAQFTEITQEARQLVYRYVRNREPLFHDDL